MRAELWDAIIIGAGPSGAIAAALLTQRGRRVLVLERETFPRFSIGESLLPYCMTFIEEAGMNAAVDAGGFQRKNGAMFLHRGRYHGFDFREKFSSGPGETYQVKRAEFDKILADEAARMGADIRYQHTIRRVDLEGDNPRVDCELPDGSVLAFEAKFLLDASGFGRVLPRLLGLEQPSDFPLRASLFTHVEDNIAAEAFDREKILITVHPEHRDVWYWLIPFSDGRCSIGVVAEPEFLDRYPANPGQRLQQLVHEDADLKALLRNARWDTPARQIRGYAADVSHLASDKYALLGNAGEFLDPVFSSGVTIAMQSASLAAATLERQLGGQQVDWLRDYAVPLKRGVDTFRAFVNAWYDGRLQDIFFFEKQNEDIRRMLSSILAGYAWDRENPFAASAERRLNSLWQYCRD